MALRVKEQRGEAAKYIGRCQACDHDPKENYILIIEGIRRSGIADFRLCRKCATNLRLLLNSLEDLEV